jgi:hypothetical protein
MLKKSIQKILYILKYMMHKIMLKLLLVIEIVILLDQYYITFHNSLRSSLSLLLLITRSLFKAHIIRENIRKYRLRLKIFSYFKDSGFPFDILYECQLLNCLNKETELKCIYSAKILSYIIFLFIYVYIIIKDSNLMSFTFKNR